MLDISRQDDQWVYEMWLADGRQQHAGWAQSHGFMPSHYPGLWHNPQAQQILGNPKSIQAGFDKVIWTRRTIGELLEEPGPEYDVQALPFAGLAAQDASVQDFDDGIAARLGGAAASEGAAPRHVRSLMHESRVIGINHKGRRVMLDARGVRSVMAAKGKAARREKQAQAMRASGNADFLRAPQRLIASAADLWSRPDLAQMTPERAARVFDLARAVQDTRPLVSGVASLILQEPVGEQQMHQQFDAIYGQGSWQRLMRKDTPAAAWIPVQALQEALDEELAQAFARWQQAHPHADAMQNVLCADRAAQNRPALWRLPQNSPLPLALGLLMEKQALAGQAVFAPGQNPPEEIPAVQLNAGMEVQAMQQALPAPCASCVIMAQAGRLDAPAQIAGMTVKRPDHLAALTHLLSRPAAAQSVLLIGCSEFLPGEQGAAPDESARTLPLGYMAGRPLRGRGMDTEAAQVLEFIAQHWHLDGMWDLLPAVTDAGAAAEEGAGWRLLIVGERRARALRHPPEIQALPVLDSCASLLEQLDGPRGLNARMRERLLLQSAPKNSRAPGEQAQADTQKGLFDGAPAPQAASGAAAPASAPSPVPVPMPVPEPEPGPAAVPASETVPDTTGQDSTLAASAESPVPQVPVQETDEPENAPDVTESAANTSADTDAAADTVADAGADADAQASAGAGEPADEAAASASGTEEAEGDDEAQEARAFDDDPQNAQQWQIPYRPLSRAGQPSTMIPRNLMAPVMAALERAQSDFGQNVDDFVAQQLHWTPRQLRERLSPEQVDAVALSIWNFRRSPDDKYKPAFLLGDRTGVGKGRVLAAMATWSAIQGRRPVFLTDNASLFRDFYRDLENIGEMHRFANPLLFSNTKLVSESGQTIASPPTKDQLRQIYSSAQMPQQYNCLLATYSQFNRKPLDDEDYQRHVRAEALLQEIESDGAQAVQAPRALRLLDRPVPPVCEMTGSFIEKFLGGAILPRQHMPDGTIACWAPCNAMAGMSMLAASSADSALDDTQQAIHEVQALIDGLQSSLEHLENLVQAGQAESINDFDPPDGAGELRIRIRRPDDVKRKLSSMPRDQAEQATRIRAKICEVPPGSGLEAKIVEDLLSPDDDVVHVSGLRPPVGKGQTGPVWQIIEQQQTLLDAAKLRLKIYSFSPHLLSHWIAQSRSDDWQGMRVNWLGSPHVCSQQLLLADESHRAAAPNSQTGRNLTHIAPQFGAILYSSATSIKDAANISFYAPLLPNGYSPEEIKGIMDRGGEPLQEVFAQSLCKNGSMIRREQDMSRITFFNNVEDQRLERNIQWNDHVADVLSACGQLYQTVYQAMERRNSDALESLARKDAASTSAGSKPAKMTAQQKSAARRKNRMFVEEWRQTTTMAQLYGINRMLQLSMTADLSADKAIEALRQGQKPVISVENTSEAGLMWLLDQRSAQQKAEAGERLEAASQAAGKAPSASAGSGDAALAPDAAGSIADKAGDDDDDTDALSEQDVQDIVNDASSRAGLDENAPGVLLRLQRPVGMRDVLERFARSLTSVRYSRFENGQRVQSMVSLLDADPQQMRGLPGLREQYEAVKALIDKVPDIPACGLDVIRERLESQGYTTAEITGRKIRLCTDDQGVQTIERRKGIKSEDARDAFNNGLVDCLLISRKGCTGISLHAGQSFADQRQRAFIEAQASGSIVARMQAWGRVNRKDEVCPPVVHLISSGLAGETRLNLLLCGSLRRMSANVTGNSSDASQQEDVPSMLNWVGNQCAVQMLAAHKDWARFFAFDEAMLGDSIKELEEAGDVLSLISLSRSTWVIDQITKRLPMLHADTQTQVMDELAARYRMRIQEFEAAGINPIASSSYPAWNAVQDAVDMVRAGVPEGKGSAFDEPVYLSHLKIDENRVPSRWARTSCESAYASFMGAHKQAVQEKAQRANAPGQDDSTMRDAVFNSEFQQFVERARRTATQRLGKHITSLDKALALAGAGQESRASMQWDAVMSSFVTSAWMPQGSLLQFTRPDGSSYLAAVRRPSNAPQNLGESFEILDNLQMAQSYISSKQMLKWMGLDLRGMRHIVDIHVPQLGEGQETMYARIQEQLLSCQKSHVMTPVLKVLARPGDDGYEALCAQWRDSFLRGRQEKAERHALTGNLFLSADLAGRLDIGKPASWRMSNGLWQTGILLPDEFTQEWKREHAALERRRNPEDADNQSAERASQAGVRAQQEAGNGRVNAGAVSFAVQTFFNPMLADSLDLMRYMAESYAAGRGGEDGLRLMSQAMQKLGAERAKSARISMDFWCRTVFAQWGEQVFGLEKASLKETGHWISRVFKDSSGNPRPKYYDASSVARDFLRLSDPARIMGSGVNDKKAPNVALDYRYLPDQGLSVKLEIKLSESGPIGAADCRQVRQWLDEGEKNGWLDPAQTDITQKNNIMTAKAGLQGAQMRRALESVMQLCSRWHLNFRASKGTSAEELALFDRVRNWNCMPREQMQQQMLPLLRLHGETGDVEDAIEVDATLRAGNENAPGLKAGGGQAGEMQDAPPAAREEAAAAQGPAVPALVSGAEPENGSAPEPEQASKQDAARQDAGGLLSSDPRERLRSAMGILNKVFGEPAPNDTQHDKAEDDREKVAKCKP